MKKWSFLVAAGLLSSVSLTLAANDVNNVNALGAAQVKFVDDAQTQGDATQQQGDAASQSNAAPDDANAPAPAGSGDDPSAPAADDGSSTSGD